MKISNVSLHNVLHLKEDCVHSMVIRPHRLYGRIVQSFIALSEGLEPLENFTFKDDRDEALHAEKLLYVVTDPFRLDLNNRKLLTALYGRVESLILADMDQQSEWMRLMLNAADMIAKCEQQLNVEMIADREPSVQDFCKAINLRISTHANDEVHTRLYTLMDMISEWMPEKLLVLCNIAAYLSSEQLSELCKYACYTKVKLLLLEQALSDSLISNEIRWLIDTDFDDRILEL